MVSNRNKATFKSISIYKIRPKEPQFRLSKIFKNHNLWAVIIICKRMSSMWIWKRLKLICLVSKRKVSKWGIKRGKWRRITSIVLSTSFTLARKGLILSQTSSKLSSLKTLKASFKKSNLKMATNWIKDAWRLSSVTLSWIQSTWYLINKLTIILETPAMKILLFILTKCNLSQKFTRAIK